MIGTSSFIMCVNECGMCVCERERGVGRERVLVYEGKTSICGVKDTQDGRWNQNCRAITEQ